MLSFVDFQPWLVHLVPAHVFAEEPSREAFQDVIGPGALPLFFGAHDIRLEEIARDFG